MSKFTSCFILLMGLYAATAAAQEPQPTPEMQKLVSAQLGRWSQREERADGSSGRGEAVWQAGPGGMSLVENEYVRSSTGEMVGLSVTWWDEAVKGYRALWCDNKIKSGCLVMSKPAHWEGAQFVLGDEFERDGKKLVYKEVQSEITPSTYTLTSYIGEPGGELKPVSTIHATKVTDSAASSQQIDSAFHGLWTLNAEKSDFGNRAKPKAGFVNWGEHGWTFAIVQADGRIYADAAETSHGCVFIGMAPKDLSCEVEVVTPRHVRLTVRQGATVHRIGDIELLDDGTTQTTHHITPSQGAPYVEKTIWEKQVRK